MAPALFTETRGDDADQPRRDLRAGGRGDSREGLRGSARGANDDAIRPVSRHRHDVAQARESLQAEFDERAGDGESADGRPRLSRAVRRPKEVELRPARAGDATRGSSTRSSRRRTRRRNGAVSEVRRSDRSINLLCSADCGEPRLPARAAVARGRRSGASTIWLSRRKAPSPAARAAASASIRRCAAATSSADGLNTSLMIST